jgi:hypothetical protein
MARLRQSGKAIQNSKVRIQKSEVKRQRAKGERENLMLQSSCSNDLAHPLSFAGG